MSSSLTRARARAVLASTLLPVTVLATFGAFLCAPTAGAATKAEDVLRVTSLQTGTKAAPVRLVVRVADVDALSVSVNGRRDDNAFVNVRRNLRTLGLSVGDGLRPGANTIRITATRPDGTSDRDVRTVRLDPALPLADAGGDLSVAVSRGARLGTSNGGLKGSVQSRRFHWRIVSAPKGSRARLVNANQAQPTMRSLRHGTYRLRLTTSAPDGSPRSHDTVSLHARPDGERPIGVSFTTDKAGNHAIAIDGQSLRNTTPPPSRGHSISFAVLGRQDRHVVDSNHLEGTDGGIDILLDRARDNFGSIVIVAAQDGVEPRYVDKVGALLARIGGSLTDENRAALRAGAPFSFVGVAGGVPGSAWVSIPPTPLTPGVDATIMGLLQWNVGTGNYDLVRPEHPEFNTRAAGSTATRNVIQVGKDRYPVDIPAGGAGVQLLVLERGTLRPMRNTGYPLGTYAQDRLFATDLGGAVAEPGRPLIFLQTINTPRPHSQAWDEIARLVDQIGGNRLLVLNLDGASEYSYVGRQGAERPIAENGGAQDSAGRGNPKPSGTLGGVLSLTRSSSYEPLLAAEPGAVDDDMLQIAYGPGQDFPAFAPGGEQKAARYFATAAGFCNPPLSSCDLRVNYSDNYQADWHQTFGTISTLKFRSRGTPAGISEDEFTDVQSQLSREIAAINTVKTYIAALQAPFLSSTVESQVDLARIARTLYDNAQPPAASTATTWTLGLIGKIVALGAFLPPPANGVAAGLSAGFMLGSYLSTPRGTPVAGAAINAKASELSSQLISSMKTSLEALDTQGILFVSDWGKLQAAARRVNNEWKLPPTNARALASMRLAANRTIAEALVPAATPHLLRATPGLNNGRDLDCRIIGGGRYFDRVPDSSQIFAIDGYYPDGTPYRTFFLVTKVLQPFLPDEFAKSLFRPVDAEPAGLGMEKLSFFSRRVFGKILRADHDQLMCDLYVPDQLGLDYFKPYL